SGEKRVFLVILFTSFSGSLVSRISGAVHLLEKNQPLGRLAKSGNKLLYDNNYVAIPTFKMLD
ncbi:hypothetical protein NY759_05530, partial [Escherichia coli]|uniref:hypothetical protein n=1 Tax=Escherichia coli TaxID=562 RepID=UPI0024800A97